MRVGYAQVWQEPSGRWRWRYVPPSVGGPATAPLPSSRDFASAEEARQTALAAYPNVAMTVLDGAEELPPGAWRRTGRRVRAAAVVVAAGVALARLALAGRRRLSH